jgi:hypothetical protein
VRLLLVLYLDEVNRLLSDVLIVRGDGDDALAEEAHSVRSQDRHILDRAAPRDRGDVRSG